MTEGNMQREIWNKETQTNKNKQNHKLSTSNNFEITALGI
jgi:hypothetical protein